MNDLSTAIPPDTAYCGSFHLESQGEFLYCQLLKKNCPITIFAQTDYMTLAVGEVILKSGMIIPKDVALVGFDNIAVS
jgi:DNA-binding LacI/PurR family transcriptional regulator